MERDEIEAKLTDRATQKTAAPTAPQAQVQVGGGRVARRDRRLALACGGVFVIVLILLIALGINSRLIARRNLEMATRLMAVPEVIVVHPLADSKAQEVVLPGNTQGFIDTSIYARTNGYLKQWFVDIGAHVRAGQLLAIIDAPELDQELRQAQADLKSNQASQRLAETTNIRWQGLIVKHAVSQQEADQVASDLAAKQAATDASEANVRRLLQLQEYERVTAPFDGVITARDTDVGALIDAGAGTQPHELFHIEQLGKLRVFVAVPEVYADSVRDGDRVDMTLGTAATRTFSGIITRNSNAISPVSHTLNVEVDVDNTKGGLLPGAYVFVHMKFPGGTHSVTIPSNALLFRAEGLQAGVVRDGNVVQLVRITVGHDFGSTVEVTSGLTTTDAVILDPSDSLMSGMRVDADSNSGGAVD
jgi:RND family efflux transporter MFP subunit